MKNRPLSGIINSKGKRGGLRVLLAFKAQHRAIFMYGFAKNERDNITLTEELVYKKLAKYFLEASILQIEKLIKSRELLEVTYEKE